MENKNEYLKKFFRIFFNVEEKYIDKKTKKVFTIFGLKITFTDYKKMYEKALKTAKKRSLQLRFFKEHTDITMLKPAFGELRQIQMELLNFAVFLTGIFERENIKYFLDCGNALGAIRHRGFIPWDDDFDIGMMREDYIKCIEYCKNNFISIAMDNIDISSTITKKLYFKLQEAFKQNPNKLLYSKRHNMLQIFKGTSLGEFVSLDIFPFDYYRDDYTFQEHKNYLHEISKTIKKIGTLDKICDFLDKELKTNSNIVKQSNTIFFGIDSLSSYDSPASHFFKADKFFPLKKVQFENTELSAVNDISYFVENELGQNYMEYPKDVGISTHLRKRERKKVCLVGNDKLKNKIEKIDLVYLWVDGNDEKFKQEKRFWQNKLNIAQDANNNACRYVEHEELRYSLRSVAKNAPWVNKIFIVTNGQVPAWLDTSNPKIKIITHKEIMPDEILPTFNSSVIESYVTAIPGLSEHFLLANDDCYINKPVKPSFFFDKKGRPIVRLVKCDYTNKNIENNLYISTVAHSLNVFYGKYKKLIPKTYEPHHNIDAYTKSAYDECIKEFQPEFNKLRQQKFRDYSIQRVIHALYLLEKKQSKLDSIVRNYSNYKMSKSLYMRINKLDSMIKMLCMKQPSLICINDVSFATPQERDDAQLLYETLYPTAQDWEKTKVQKVDENKLEQCRRLYQNISRKILMKKCLTNIFSITNENRINKKHKILTILGIKMKFKIKGRNDE